MTALDTKALLTGVTPGAWLHEHRETKVSGGMYSTEIYTEDGGSGHGVIATLSWYPRPMDERGAIGTYREANARLIAEAPRLARRVIELEEALGKAERALQRMMDTWLDYHDAHSLTEPVTGASANAFDDALEARDLLAALKGEGE